MSQPDDESTAAIDRALEESQRVEREELHADLERQRATDERIAKAIAKDQD